MQKVKISRITKDVLPVVVLSAYFGFAYFLSCAILDGFMPRFMTTERTAHEFWFFGWGALCMCGAAVALFRGARRLSGQALARVFLGAGIIMEAFIFLGALGIWYEAEQYAIWAASFGPLISVASVEAHYWIVAVLCLNGILGNLLGALLTA